MGFPDPLTLAALVERMLEGGEIPPTDADVLGQVITADIFESLPFEERSRLLHLLGATALVEGLRQRGPIDSAIGPYGDDPGPSLPAIPLAADVDIYPLADDLKDHPAVRGLRGMNHPLATVDARRKFARHVAVSDMDSSTKEVESLP